MTDQTNVIKLRRSRKSIEIKPRSRSVKASKALRRQTYTAAVIGTIALVLVGLSLTHLAHGIQIITKAPTWEAIAMAIGTDLGYIAAEFSMLFATTDKLRKAVSRFAKPVVVGTMIGSAAMNAFAFTSQVDGWMMAPAAILGAAITAMIYALTRIGAEYYLDCHAKA